MGYINYNPNPARKLVGDCVIRAISKVTGQSWEDTYLGLWINWSNSNQKQQGLALCQSLIYLRRRTLLDFYKGYKRIEGDSEYINLMLSPENYKDWCINEYAIIKNVETGQEFEMRFAGDKFVNLKLPNSKYIKGKNAEQRCALDALNNDNITAVAILGSPGSGKSYITMKMGLYRIREKGTQAKILCVREAWGEGKEIGFLPGDISDKIAMFQLPFIQQMDGGIWEYERLVQEGKLDSNVLYYMKGTTYDETIMLCDEAEDLTEKQIKLVGTRIGKNSKIYFSGDYKQSLLDSTEFNPLLRMCEKLKGNPLFACVYLPEDVRSETSKMFADLFD